MNCSRDACRRRRRSILALAASALLFVACGGGGKSGGGAAAAKGSPIRIGVLADMNGTSATTGAAIHIATDLALRQINAAGGINGHPLQAIYVDPKSDPAEAVQMGTQLVQQEHADILIGGVLSSECLGLEQLAPRLGVVYAPDAACAAEELTSKQCNKYTFRFQPVGNQVIAPLAGYMVQTYGKRWALAYSDFAYGLSQLAAYDQQLQKLGGAVLVRIPMPVNESNVVPYVTKIPTDGSVDGVIVAGLSAGDQARFIGAMQQFGINKKLPVISSNNKDSYGGTYPDAVNGSIGSNQYLVGYPPGNKYSADYERAYKEMAAQDVEDANILGGVAKIASGQGGYIPYAVLNALKEGMIAARFSGRADTDRLIAALENLKAPLSGDFPGGDVLMNKADHQGTMTTYVYKIDGQNEDVLSTVPADKIPPNGNCHV